jgi:disintegrin and metalloproteinase domain-containing protein 10
LEGSSGDVKEGVVGVVIQSGNCGTSYSCFVPKLQHRLILADFNQDGKPDNISFMVKRIKVHSMDALKDSNYRFPLNYGVEKFLELFSGMWSV